MENNNQSLEFHHFIELSANKSKETERFPEFQFMEQIIRKNYKQVKKTKNDKNLKPPEKFVEYFKNLQKEDQVRYYGKCVKVLEKAISTQASTEQRNQQKQNLKKQGEVYIKKSILNSWQKKKIKLENLHFCIQESKKSRSYPLKEYGIRKSKNKEHYGWVLEFISNSSKKKFKNIHCGVRNIKQFEQWYNLIQKSIFFTKHDNYRSQISGTQPKQPPLQQHCFPQAPNMKTLTELTIDNQMKISDDFVQPIEQAKVEDENVQQPRVQPQSHPNVFKKLFENIDVDLFTLNTAQMELKENGQGYRLFELPPLQGEDFRLRINIMLPYNKSLVFKALNEEVKQWNNDIDNFSVKTKISSENSALIYQKDKPQGILYRQRDYLYIRHCFSMKSSNPNQKDKIFIADKSIDSINFPPFMTVARGEKKIVTCISGNQQDKECMLIVDGQIKGGGYMNTANDKEMTIKFFKRFLGLQNHLKEKQFLNKDQKPSEVIFEENWEVEQQEQEFFDLQDDSDQESKEKQTQTSKKNDQNMQEVNENQQQNEQFEEFILKTSQQLGSNLASQIKSQKILNQEITGSQLFAYDPPQFASDKTVIIPQNYLKTKHILAPTQKPKNSSVFPHIKGHHLWKGQWEVNPTGGLNYIDQQKMNEQKKVLTFIIKRIGKNILSGKGILNISLPVDIFCRQSNIERLAASFGFAPFFLEKAAHLEDPKEQLKYVVATACYSSLIYMAMQKPFNPILGETYQSWIDGCPLYFQQISHHPPIAAYMMVGRGYRISGTLEAKMDLSINSGSGTNEGIFTVEFDNGRKFYYTTATGELSGLTYGERKLLFIGKTYYWSIDQGLFLQLQFNPGAKNRRFFGGANQGSSESHLQDYVEGTLRKYKKEDLKDFLTPKKGDTRKIMAIPKSSPSTEPQSQFYKVTGRWTKYLSFDGTKTFDVDENRYCTMKDEENPLASHSNYRQDVVYRRLNDFVSSQQFKEVLEVKQRKDKKLRQNELKNKK